MAKKNGNINRNIEYISKEIQSDDRYKQLGMNTNPFPISGIPKYPILDPFDSTHQNRINEYLISTLKKVINCEDGWFASLAIIGDYGSGKTHLMKYIEQMLIELTEKKNIQTISAFLDLPYDTPQKIIHSVIDKIGFEAIKRFIWKVIADSILKSEIIKLENYFEKNLLTEQNLQHLMSDEILFNYHKFLNKFDEYRGDVNSFTSDCSKCFMESITDDSTIAQKYINIVFPRKHESVEWDVLTGFSNTRDFNNKEVVFLNSIVKLLQYNGYHGLYVFIDEFEDIPKLKGAKLSDYLKTLNTLINVQRKWTSIISITNEALDQIKQLSPPLYDRLTTMRINLTALEQDEAIEIVNNYFQTVRIDDNLDCPFDNELIDKVRIDTSGNIRAFLQKFQRITEKAASQAIKPPITIEILKDVK